MLQFVEIHTEAALRLPFFLNTVGENRKQPPVCRQNDFHEFIWVKEGRGEFEVKGERFLLEAGEGLFLRAGIPHAYKGEHFYTAWCTFIMPTEALDYLGIGDFLFFHVPLHLDREADQLSHFAAGESTLFSRSTAGYSFVMELFSAILSSEDTLSDKVLRFLEQHYAESLSLEEIAAAFYIDRYALCRIYKRERDITVMDDLLRIRLSKAKRFLKYGAEPVSQVGSMCGFESPGYFTKRFREAVGMTPTEYRKRFDSI